MSGLPLVILGAGPAGLAAAYAASATGQPVLVIDDNPEPGGQIWRGGSPGWNDRRAERLWAGLRARPHVRFLPGVRVVASAGPRTVLLDAPDGPSTLQWERVIVCGGARELLLPFPGWTLPGVTGAGGLQALAKGGMPVKDKRIVVAGTGPLLLAVADTVRRRGGTVAAIVEHRSSRDLVSFGKSLALSHQAKLLQSLRLFAGLRGVPYLRGASLRSANGSGHLSSVTITHDGREVDIPCDFAACGFGLVPSTEAAALFGCAVVNGRVQVGADMATSVPGVWAAGELTGIGGVDKALAEGAIAGSAAVGVAATAREIKALARAHAFADLLAASFAPAPRLARMCGGSTIVCRCEDVRAAELAPFQSWRAAKLQTRIGMGSCQGRVCGAACEFMYGWDAGGDRPPVFPVSAGTLARVAET